MAKSGAREGLQAATFAPDSPHSRETPPISDIGGEIREEVVRDPAHWLDGERSEVDRLWLIL